MNRLQAFCRAPGDRTTKLTCTGRAGSYELQKTYMRSLHEREDDAEDEEHHPPVLHRDEE